MPVHVSLRIIPLGVGVSLSRYVARAIEILREKGYNPVICPSETSFEAESIEEIGSVVAEIHEALIEMGAMRIVTSITIDDRRDKYVPLREKVARVEEASPV